MSTKKKLLEAAAGNAGEAIYVDDVFSTDLYTGTGSAETVTNNIDLSGEGGMVWLKQRTNAGSYFNHQITDTVRGKTYHLSTNTTEAEGALSVLSSFNSDGYTAGSSISNNNTPIVGWTFRKQPGFFDVVTYTGTGSNQNISHNLGSTPGTIFIKNTSATNSWVVYHRSVGATAYLQLNTVSSSIPNSTRFNNTEPTSTQFTVGTNGEVNANGNIYVAYLFAHDAQDFGTNSDESIIKCGSYTGDGASSKQIDLGFEPQWVLVKRSGPNTGSWYVIDSMRGAVVGGNDALLVPNTSASETSSSFLSFNSTGFNLGPALNASGEGHIYVAIRRPHKPAEEFAATDLFGMDTWDNGPPQFTSGFPVDMAFWKDKTNNNGDMTLDRLRSIQYLQMSSTVAEQTSNLYKFDYMDGYGTSTSTFSSIQSWMFRRAPGFFDVVTYAGTGSAQNISHNLNAVPEMLVVKARSTTGNWMTYHSGLNGGTNPEGYYAIINGTNAQLTDGSGAVWNNTAPTSSQFSVNTASFVNGSGTTYVAYLFATVPGISKVGNYSGTGSNLTIDCGFSSGARFVLIKSTTFAGGWYLWDSARGITTGNDYHLKLNDTSAQATDSVVDIEPDSSGFILNGPNANINSSGNDYIFLAIA